MIGALIGDISGSRYERFNHKSKEFVLFDKKCRVTDDSVMSLAVAKAILECDENYESLSQKAIESMQDLGRTYKNAGYGGSFIQWIMSEDPQPYNSFGNGSAMRVGPCGYAAKSIEEAKELSSLVTKISHDHPEGMKGAEAVAIAIYLAKTGKNKEEIKEYINENYYKTDFTIDQIRGAYKFDVSCQGSVPVALEAFFESTDFEDAIRNAISVGGDSDTIAAITGSIAEAFYGVPEGIIGAVIDYLDSREMEILYYFEKKYSSKALDEDGESSLTVFEVIDDYVDRVIPAGTPLRVDEEYPSGAVHAWVDSDSMIPDFSSFDKKDKTKEAKEMISKAGAELSKGAKSAGKGFLSIAKSVKESVDKSREKAASKTVNCYEIENNDLEDTERTISAVELLKKAGYDARVRVVSGTMYGYVFTSLEEYEKAIETVKDIPGISIGTTPVEKHILDALTGK